MPLFSERNNLCPKKILQVECINYDLKVALWNIFYELYLYHFTSTLSNKTVQERYFFEEIFVNFFKIPLDQVHSFTLKYEYVNRIKNSAFFNNSENFPWYKPYDFLEFVLKNDYDKKRAKDLESEIKKILKKEVSGYRLIKSQFTRIISDVEINEVEKAINNNASNKVTIHLEQALIHLSNKESPDYRNSIKESISAVESFCKILTGNPNITLGPALESLEEKANIQINPALKEGFKKIYGWTSSADGIRHGLMDEPNVRFEDAQFMLTACSAFINYLSEKKHSNENTP